MSVTTASRGHRATKRFRGFLLVEAMLAAAMLATMLAAVMHFMLVPEQQTQAAVRRSQAVAAVWDAISNYRSRTYTTMGTVTLGTVTDYPPGVVSRVVTLSKLATSSNCPDCYQADITVTYLNAVRQNQIVTAQAWIPP